MNLVLVICGAAIGAPLRYLVDRSVQARHCTLFPWGTLSVNVIASLVLGLVTGAVTAGAASHHLQLLVGTGFCATLSTYSTFSFETVRLAEQRAGRLAAANVALSIAAGLAAAFAGIGLAHLFWG
jgi:CrcB protein